MSHSIRLRGPWEWGLVHSLDSREKPQRIELPADLGQWTPPDATVWLRRRFNAPTGIGETDDVALQLSGLEGEILALELNGHRFPCSTESSHSLDIHRWLDSHNVLTITLRRDGGHPVGLLGSATIVIVPPPCEDDRPVPPNVDK